MSKAKLNYISGSTCITLESGSLFYLDHCTSKYSTFEDLISGPEYSSKIGTTCDTQNSQLILEYIKDSENKEQLPILYGDKSFIYIRNNYYENEISEVEKARKLLLSSKNKSFLKGFLSNKILSSSANFEMKLSYKQNIQLHKYNIKVNKFKDEYYLNLLELFKHILFVKKYGFLRTLFEDALEYWKKNLFELDDEQLYYYCRNLRILRNKYIQNINVKKGIKNLRIVNNNLKLLYYDTNLLQKSEGKILKKVS